MTDDRSTAGGPDEAGAWNRRHLLRLGGGLALGTAVGGALGLGQGTAAAASPAAPTAPVTNTAAPNTAAPTAAALPGVPVSKRFDLTEPSHDLFRHATLHDDTVQQSFCYDIVNKRLFVAQRQNSTDWVNGQLCVTELDFDGNYRGYMHLNGFGHGVSIAAQPVGSTTYLWTEVDIDAESERGVRLARFAWQSGKTLSNTSSALTKHKPVPEGTAMTAAIDPVFNRMAVRYAVAGGGHRYAIFNLAEVAAGNYANRLADFAQPPGPGVSFQGYTLYGSYVYQLRGQSYDEAPEGNTHVSSVDVNTGAEVQSFRTGAGSTLTFREPEGMAVYRTSAGEVRLFLGFASGAAGDRRSNLFYKNVLV